MTDAQSLADNFKSRMLQDYPKSDYIVEALPSSDRTSIEIVVKDLVETSRFTRFSVAVEDFHVERLREAVWAEVPPRRSS